jgi:glutamate racemase
MIGVFDSGYGGLTILKALKQRLPEYGYCYFGDNANAPYGSRDREQIFTHTKRGVDFLFDQGCELVVLACNTSSANALRTIQREVLPDDPQKRVLGILVPTIEQLSGRSWTAAEPMPPDKKESRTVGVIATEQTVASGAYKREVEKRNGAINIIQQACPNLVPLIEQNAPDRVLDSAVKKYLKNLFEKAEGEVDDLLLGCTHYALIERRIKAHLPRHVSVYNQPEIVAGSLEDYLKRNTGIEKRIDTQSRQLFYTSGHPHNVTQASIRFYGQSLPFKKI